MFEVGDIIEIVGLRPHDELSVTYNGCHARVCRSPSMMGKSFVDIYMMRPYPDQSRFRRGREADLYLRERHAKHVGAPW